MSIQGPNDNRPRASRNIKLVLMGVAGAAMLYSCAPGIGAGLGALPYLWFFSNPFYRGAPPTACGPGSPASPECAPGRTGSSGGGSGIRAGGSSGSSTADAPAGATSSQRTGFGSSAAEHGATGTS